MGLTRTTNPRTSTLDLAARVAQAATPEELVDAVAAYGEIADQSAQVFVCVFDDGDPGTLLLTGSIRTDATRQQGRFPVAHSLSGAVASSGHTIVVPLWGRSEVDVRFFDAERPATVVVAPLLSGPSASGALCVRCWEAPEAGFERIVEGLGRLAAIHLDRMAENEKLASEVATRREHTGRLYRLHEIERGLSSAMSLDSVLEVLSTSIAELVDVARVSFARRGPGPAESTLFGVLGMEALPAGTVLPLDVEHFEAQFRERPFVYTPDHLLSGDPQHEALARGGLRASLNIGVFAHGEPVGTLNVGAEQPNSLTSEDRALLVALASFMGSTLERLDAQERLSYEARHDHLTGLIRRDLLEDLLDEELERLRSTGRTAGLCFVDIDRFKMVNDAHGHLAGDDLLRDLAARFRRVVGSRGVISRVGGDEFLVILREPNGAARRATAQEIVDSASSHPVYSESHTVECTVSLGLCDLTADIASRVEAIGRADAACYTAKRRGGDSVCVASDSDVEQRQIRVAAQQLQELKAALGDDRLRLHVQPIERLATGTIDAVEVLVRMTADDGVLPPAAFIPVAERFGLIGEVDRLVLERALQMWPAVRDRYGSEVRLFINLSPTSLSTAGFEHVVLDLLGSSDIPSERICFEITETGMMRNFETALRFVERVRDAGVGVALDDFGTGLSSLGHLRRLPVDVLKIDGSLVRGVQDDPVQETMVAAIVSLARALGISTIAEHVEDGGVRERLSSLGVDYAQGFGIGRPRPLP